MSNEIQELRNVPLFSTMDDNEIAGILAIMDENSFAPGQVIMREGEPGDYFHVITEGNVEFLTQDASGKELVLDSAGPGGFFGELSMLTGELRSARVRAVDAVKTLALDRAEFYEFLMKQPHAAIDVLTVIGRRLHRTDRLLRERTNIDANKLDEERQTFGMRLSDGFAAVMGSWSFIIWQSCILAVWVAYNGFATYHNNHADSKWWLWDEYPFIFLNLALSFQAAYAAPIIMMSQNRAANKDRLVADIDHKVNIKAETEVSLIMSRLDDLERSVHHNHKETRELVKEHGAKRNGS
jgi:CRP/FNR family cyclic AMP-dependent transcriptional regulator